MYLGRTDSPLALPALVVGMMVVAGQSGQSPARAQNVYCVTDKKIAPCDKTQSNRLTATPSAIQKPTKLNRAGSENGTLKGDLRGFFPGMGVVAFQEVLKTIDSIKCIESNFRLRCSAEGVSGTIDYYEFSFLSTPPEVLLDMKLRFISSNSFEDLITWISTQYNSSPTTSGVTASWHLSEERLLTFGSVFGLPNQYELTLSGEGMRRMEKDLVLKKEMRTVNPKPGF
jgi:hypothetical protein